MCDDWKKKAQMSLSGVLTPFKSNNLKTLKSDNTTRFVRWWRLVPASLQSVLRLFVPPQVHFPLEAFAAQVAAERFVSGVFPAVRDEVGALAERFPAHLTFVWLLTWKTQMRKYFFLGLVTCHRTSATFVYNLHRFPRAFTHKLRTDYFLIAWSNNNSSTCLCGWKCASSCRTSGGTSSRSTGRGTAECRSGWAGASTGSTTFWNFCRIFCSRNFFPENVSRCGGFFLVTKSSQHNQPWQKNSHGDNKMQPRRRRCELQDAV